jgi:mono/diheme cytochrome c family protein
MLKIFDSAAKQYLFFILMLTIGGVAHAADTARGGELYTAHCADCHGISGVSIMPDAPSFAQNEGLMKPDSLLLESISKGGGGMPAYSGMLSDQDMFDVIAFIRTLN